jgi:hypothetical protein
MFAMPVFLPKLSLTSSGAYAALCGCSATSMMLCTRPLGMTFSPALAAVVTELFAGAAEGLTQLANFSAQHPTALKVVSVVVASQALPWLLRVAGFGNGKSEIRRGSIAAKWASSGWAIPLFRKVQSATATNAVSFPLRVSCAVLAMGAVGVGGAVWGLSEAAAGRCLA